ncbi:MAG: hypothetical protein AAF264_00440 [Pseudomonadota bacterium]
MTHHAHTPAPTDALHADVRRLLDAVEALLDRSERPVAEPIEQMLADLSAIRNDLVACAAAMTQVADAVRLLATRPDPSAEIARLRRELQAARRT